jgi:hypothetical protein
MLENIAQREQVPANNASAAHSTTQIIFWAQPANFSFSKDHDNIQINGRHMPIATAASFGFDHQ